MRKAYVVWALIVCGLGAAITGCGDPVVSSEDAGEFVSAVALARGFLAPQISVIETTTGTYTVNGFVSARRGAQCRVLVRESKFRMLEIEGSGRWYLVR